MMCPNCKTTVGPQVDASGRMSERRNCPTCRARLAPGFAPPARPDPRIQPPAPNERKEPS